MSDKIRHPLLSNEAVAKLIIFTMGGKGGVGKTGLMCALIEWFLARGILHTALDLDTENKAKGSLSHFYGGTIPKVNIFTPSGLDAFIDYLDTGAQIILADMGAGSGQVTYEWFNTMHDAVAAAGIRFTAIGVITDDPASVESVLTWADQLQDRVDYLIVENNTTQYSKLAHWREATQAHAFREAFAPHIITMSYRVPRLELACRNHGVPVGQVAELRTDIPEFRDSVQIMRAQSVRQQIFSEFDKVKEMLKP